MAKKVEVEDNQTVSCLRNEKVCVRYVPRQSHMVTDPKHILYGGMAEDAVKTFVVPKLTTGTYVNVLTNSEMAFLENYLGMEKGTLSVYKKQDNFWSDANPQGINKVKLRKQDNYLDFLHSNKSIFSDENDTNTEVKKMKTEVKGLDKAPNEHIPQQIIFYGVPGSGKSFSISGTLKNANKVILEENTKRVVFHPEYSNSDFIGQILPKMTTSGINYVFTPGPFTQILRKAYQHPENNYALIIEEINRGNAAAIFGELFQLLDRLEEDEKQPLNNVYFIF